MLEELTDQLRRYGDAVEVHVLDSDAVVTQAPERRRRVLLLPVAAAIVLFVAAVATLAFRDEPRTTDVATEGPQAPATTAPAVPTTLDIEGTVEAPDLDPRAELRVAACPEDDVSLACPSVRTVSVEDDGSFVLPVTVQTPPRRWNVVAFVAATDPSCVFNCRFPAAPRNAVVSEIVSVTAAPGSRRPVRLSLSTRVVDVVVRDRNGNPFAGGGVQVTDARCTDDACPDEPVPMFVQAAPDTGGVRLVLDPDTRYEIHGQATNMGWPDPAWTNDGNTFWFSPSVTLTGRELAEGHVFRVDGAAA